MSKTSDSEIVRVSQKGQATIPKSLRDKLGIDAPGEVIFYEDNERIIVEPVPSIGELAGIHADESTESGEILETVAEEAQREREREEATFERLHPRRQGTDDE